MSESIENILARRLEKSRALCQKIYPPSAAHDENFKVDYGQRDIRSKYNHYLLQVFPMELSFIQDSLTFKLPHGRYEQFCTDHTKLYHYTTIHGLKGIIDNKFIWMNDTKYMNDSSEIIYQDEIFSSIITKYKRKYSKHIHINMLLNSLEKSIGKPQDSMPYIACFSHDGDNLSLWRAYGNNGGISIGFDLSTKYKFIDNPDSIFVDMEYRKGIQKKLITSILDHTIEIIDEDIIKSKNLINDKYIWVRIHETITPFILRAMRRMKHPSFKDECETRLVLRKEDLPKGSVKFRIKGNLLTPYYEKRATINKKIVKWLPIFKVIVGPCPEQELVQNSIKEFLSSKGYKKVIVEGSKIPYRQI